MKSLSFIPVFFLTFQFVYSQSRIIGNAGTNNSSGSVHEYQEPIFFPYELDSKFNIDGSFQSRLNPNFQLAAIITNENDTLFGLIKYGYPDAFDKVIYRSDSIAPDSTVSVSNIKSIITQYVYLTKVLYKGKERMVRWMAVGRINLYAYIKYYGEWNSEVIYVLKKPGNQLIYINKKDFKTIMRHSVFDIPDLSKKIGKKGYRFADVFKIVTEYNKKFR